MNASRKVGDLNHSFLYPLSFPGRTDREDHKKSSRTIGDQRFHPAESLDSGGRKATEHHQPTDKCQLRYDRSQQLLDKTTETDHLVVLSTLDITPILVC